MKEVTKMVQPLIRERYDYQRYIIDYLVEKMVLLKENSPMEIMMQ